MAQCVCVSYEYECIWNIGVPVRVFFTFWSAFVRVWCWLWCWCVWKWSYQIVQHFKLALIFFFLPGQRTCASARVFVCVHIHYGEWRCCFRVFWGSVLALPRAMSANAIRLKEEPLFTWITIRILSASSQRNGPSGFGPSSLTVPAVQRGSFWCAAHTPSMWQRHAC